MKPRSEDYFEIKADGDRERLAFKRTSLFAQTAGGWYGPVIYLGAAIRPIARGEARRFARAILRLTDKP